MHLGIIVGVQIDEARRDDQAGGVDDLRGVVRFDLAHLGDAAIADGDVARETRQPSAVDDGAVPDNRVVLTHVLSPGLRCLGPVVRRVVV